MPPDIAEKVLSHFSTFPKRVYPKGQIIVFADESPGHVFYMVKGRVIEYDISYRGDEVVINEFKPPAFFPMSWALNGTENKYFYKTDAETELHVVPAEMAVEFVKTNPDVMFDLLCRVYRGLDGMLGRMVHLMSGSAKNRLIYELVVEARRFGEKQPDGSYLLATRETDIAARAGLSRETVNREMHQLKLANQIRITGNSIFIIDLPTLESAIGGRG